MAKLSRCEKNLIRGKAFDFLQPEIDTYRSMKKEYEEERDETKKEEKRKALIEFDHLVTNEAFNFALVADCIFSALNEGFEAIERMDSDIAADEENKDGTDSD